MLPPPSSPLVNLFSFSQTNWILVIIPAILLQGLNLTFSSIKTKKHVHIPVILKLTSAALQQQLIVHLRDFACQCSLMGIGGGLTGICVWADIAALKSAPRVQSVCLIPLIQPPLLVSVAVDVVKDTQSSSPPAVHLFLCLMITIYVLTLHGTANPRDCWTMQRQGVRRGGVEL